MPSSPCGAKLRGSVIDMGGLRSGDGGSKERSIALAMSRRRTQA
jgi:hypothetical protein